MAVFNCQHFKDRQKRKWWQDLQVQEFVDSNELQVVCKMKERRLEKILFI